MHLPMLNSYPSGHMFRFAFIALLAARFLTEGKHKRMGANFAAALIIACVVMALTRVYIGDHWASDVIGALLLAHLTVLWVPKLSN